MGSLRSVLVVDDDPGMNETMKSILMLEGYRVSVAACGEEAVELCRQQRFSSVLLDIHMPGMDGVETLIAIKQLDPWLRVIMITGTESNILSQRAMAAGAEAVFRKPLDVAQFLPLLMI